MFFRSLLSIGFIFILNSLSAQISQDIEPITCYWNEFAEEAWVSPPEAFTLGQMDMQSDLVFDFAAEVPLAARDAMEFAASIWEVRLSSNVPINVEVNWESFEEENVLASAGPTTIFRSFTGAINPTTWYPVALAEAIAGENLNDQENDIIIRANSEANWYFGLDGNVPPGQIDMVSVILHELGHGLGFLSSADVNDDGLGELGFGGFPIIFDVFLETNSGQGLANNSQFPNPSQALENAFTGNALVFADGFVADQNLGDFPPLFAPGSFDRGSSISHLDEFAFPTGSENALMSPRLAFREAIQDPGPVGLAIMQAIGWPVFFLTNSREENLPQALALFPNPSSGLVNIIWPDLGINSMDYQLLNSTGQVLVQGKIVPGQTLDIGAYPGGFYQLQLQSDERRYVSRLILN